MLKQVQHDGNMVVKNEVGSLSLVGMSYEAIFKNYL